MDREWIRRNLPEEPPAGMMDWAKKELARELGGEKCIFHAERIYVPPTLAEVMEYDSVRPRRKEWVGCCVCTACHEEFYAEKVRGDDAIWTVDGEDGWTYAIGPGERIDVTEGAQRQGIGDQFNCPICGHEVTMVHKRSLRNGITKQVQVATVQNVMGYTGIFYWLIRRRFREEGYSETDVIPKDAYILTEHGGLVRYAHALKCGSFNAHQELDRWQIMSGNADTIDQVYYDHGSICNKKQGTVLYQSFPDLEGSTGEKTGLVEFLEAGGYCPVGYLKKWRKYRGLENLCKCGQAKLVAQLIGDGDYYEGFEMRADPYIELKFKKPHEMLRLTKGEFQRVRKMKMTLSMDILREWRGYQRWICGSFDRYLDDRVRFLGQLSRVFELAERWGETDTDKLIRYLEKQGLRGTDVGLLVDTREMAARLYGDRVLTREELWPRRLQEAHDRLDRMLIERDDKEETQKLEEGFQRMVDWYGCLEWTDGELSVILPRCNDDLVREGKVLRHCVGGYGSGHADGTSLIFFIRRYRRPERSYYTLNISISGRPEEVQLHGYGNERHGPNKEHSHKIPAKVRAFCDRWKKEVLLPWYHRRQAEQQKEMTA